MFVNRLTPLVVTMAAMIGIARVASADDRVKPPAAEPAKEAAAAMTNAEFSFALYARLACKPGNVFFSPFSISSALAMACEGANGPTADEIVRVLGLEADPTKRRAAMQTLMSSVPGTPTGFLKKTPAVTLDTANALWGARQVMFKKEFIDILQTHYGATARTLDFVKEKDDAVKTINDWTERKTNKRIQKLVGRDDLPDDIALVITNAVYFKGEWAEPFKKAGTRDADFTLADGTKVQVPTMHLTEPYAYAKQEACAVLSIPYKGEQLSMIFVLPDAPDGLPALEKSLTPERVTTMVKSMKRERVAVALPRFHAETQYDLNSDLQALGIRLAFSDQADFKKITADVPLYFSKVIHKAFVDVNETGTEAAAATALTMRAGSAMPRPTPVFRADHPFVFMIHDAKTGQILFMGRLADPRK